MSNRSGAEALWWSLPPAAATELPGVAGSRACAGALQLRPRARPDLEQQAPSELALKTETMREAGSAFCSGSGRQRTTARPSVRVRVPTEPGRPDHAGFSQSPSAGGGIRTYPGSASCATNSSSHDHWHLLGFQRYELRRADDHRLIVRDRKSGFSSPTAGNAAQGFVRASPAAGLHRLLRALERRYLIVSQGTTVGYSDVYPAHFHGQNIDVTRVQAGIYVLVHRARRTC